MCGFSADKIGCGYCGHTTCKSRKLNHPSGAPFKLQKQAPRLALETPRDIGDTEWIAKQFPDRLHGY